MKKTPYKIIMLLTVVLAALSAVSCIKTDNSHCFGDNCKIQFYYYTDQRGRGVDPAELETIHLYLFDEAGYYVGTKVYNARFENISTNPDTQEYYYSRTLSVDAGSYNFIAWVNQTDDFSTLPVRFVEGVTTREEAEFYLNKSNVTAGLKPLMYGETRLVAIPKEGQSTITVYLNQYTRKLNIWVRGASTTTASENFAYEINDRNGRHFFRGHMGSDAVVQPLSTDIKYSTVASTTDEVAFGSMTVLRLWDRRTRALGDDENARLVITRNADQHVLVDRDLIDIIQEAAANENRSGGGTRSDVDFDTRYVYDLYISFNTDMNMTVGLDKWSYFPGEVPI